MSSVDEYREAQVAEWSQYVAARPIFIGGARAFNTGDPVPAAHVNNGVVSEGEVTSVKQTRATRTADEKKDN